MASKKKLSLEPTSYYHIFLRAIGSEKIFIEEKNYYWFLHRAYVHLLPVMEIHAYTLLPDHIHLMVHIHSTDVLLNEFRKVKRRDPDIDTDPLPEFVMERVANLLNSYAKTFNLVYRRKGSLFMPARRILLGSESRDLCSFIYFIHMNAVHHGFVKHAGEWLFDSYRLHFSQTGTRISREINLSWFNGIRSFEKFHRRNAFTPDLIGIDDWL